MGKRAPVGVAAWGQPSAGDEANAVISGTFTAVQPGRAFALRGPMNVEIWGAYNTTLTTTAGSLAATAGTAGPIAAGSAINSVNVPRGTTVGAIVGAAITLALPIISLQGSVDVPASGVGGRPAITGLARTAGLLNASVTGPGIPVGTTVIAIPVPADPTNNVLGTVQLSAAPTSAPVGPFSPQNFYDFQLQASAVATGADTAATFTGGSILYPGTVQVERSFDGCATWLPCNVGGGGTIAAYAGGGPISLTFGEPERQVYYRLNCIAYTGVTGVTLNYRISTTGVAPESLSVGTSI